MCNIIVEELQQNLLESLMYLYLTEPSLSSYFTIVCVYSNKETKNLLTLASVLSFFNESVDHVILSPLTANNKPYRNM